MALYPRATLFFSLGDSGWSETHWYTTNPPTLQPVADEAAVMAKLRVQMLGVGASLIEIRVSYDDVNRDSLLGTPPVPVSADPLTLYNKNFVGFFADSAYSVILVRMEAGSLYRKSLYLSGVPDNLIVQPFIDPTLLNGDFQKAWLAWRKYMCQLTSTTPPNWGFKTISRPPDATPTKINSVVITPVTGQASLSVTAHGLVSGDQCRIYGSVGQLNDVNSNALNGAWYVTVVDANTFTLHSFAVPGYIWLGQGNVYKIVKTVKAYTNAFIVGKTHRKRGRVFATPVGRRRKARA